MGGTVTVMLLHTLAQVVVFCQHYVLSHKVMAILWAFEHDKAATLGVAALQQC